MSSVENIQNSLSMSGLEIVEIRSKVENELCITAFFGPAIFIPSLLLRNFIHGSRGVDYPAIYGLEGVFLKLRTMLVDNLCHLTSWKTGKNSFSAFLRHSK